MKSYSIGEARDSFAAIVHEAERDSALELTRRGKPVAVLLSVDEYRRLSGGNKGFWEAYSRFREGKDPEQPNISPEVFEGLRDASPGRGTAWKG